MCEWATTRHDLVIAIAGGLEQATWSTIVQKIESMLADLKPSLQLDPSLAIIVGDCIRGYPDDILLRRLVDVRL